MKVIPVVKVFFCLVLLLCLGCQSPSTTEPPVVGATPLVAESSAPVAAATSSSAGGKLSYQVPGLAPKANLQIGPTGDITTSDGSWSAIRGKGSDVLVMQGHAVVVTIVNKEAGRWDVLSADGQRTMKVKLREDGDYKVEDASEKMVVKVKKREDGFKVVDSDEETVLIKVSLNNGKIKVKDGKEKELAKLAPGVAEPLQLAWLATEKLPLAVRLGMAVSTRSGQGG